MPAFFSRSVLYVRTMPPVYQGSTVCADAPEASVIVLEFQNAGTNGLEASGSLTPMSSR